MSATPPWTCDHCGQPIEQVDDGWVEWLNRQISEVEWQSHSLRLVHNHASSPRRKAGGCQHDEKAAFARDRSIVGDLPLSMFLGPDGLMCLLEFASDRKFDLDTLIELTKRLHIPAYDQVRHSFGAAISDGVFEPNTKPTFHRQEEIQATLRWKAKQERENG